MAPGFPAQVIADARAAAKDYARLSLNDEDAVIDALAAAALGMAEAFLRTALISRPHVAVLPVSAGWQLLPASPVSAIGAVRGVLADGAAFDLPVAAYAVDVDASGDGWVRVEAGANIALVGDELLQFGVATQIGARRWRLSELWRGRRGTEAAIGTQAIGGRFVLIEPEAVTTIDLPLSAIGGNVRVLASGIGDVSGPVESGAALRGVSVLPPSPTHLRGEVLPGGDVLLRWVRRSRSGWRWIDGVDAPLVEEREAYRVMITAQGDARTIETDMAEIVVPAAEFGGGATVAVRQVGANGESLPVEILLPIA